MSVLQCALPPALDIGPGVQLIQEVFGCLLNTYFSSYGPLGTTTDDPSHLFATSVLRHQTRSQRADLHAPEKIMCLLIPTVAVLVLTRRMQLHQL